MGAATFQAAEGAAVMRAGEKYFEQVPIEVVEKILSEASALEKKSEGLGTPDSVPERRVPAESAEEERGAPFKNDR
jgi:hypothetical protein